MIFWQDSMPSAIKKIAEAGCESVEIWIEHLWRTGEGSSAISKTRQALDENGLVASVHCPITDLNITSPNKGIRDESLRQMVQAIGDAAKLGAEIIVLHPGRLHSTHGDRTEHNRLQRAALDHLVEEAARRNLVIGLENMELRRELHTVRSAEEMLTTIEGLPEEWLGVTFDISHMGDTERCVEFIQLLGPRIRHMHVSDTAPDGKPHLPFGHGIVDLNPILLELARHSFGGILSLEVFIASDLDMLQGEVTKVKQALTQLQQSQM